MNFINPETKKLKIKLDKVENKVISIQTSLKWHKRLILALYGLLGLFLLNLISKTSITGFTVLNHQEVINMDWQPLLIVGAALLRSILGWAKASLKDGFIQDFEIKKLGETIIGVGLIGAVVAYFPGVDITWGETAAVALGGHILLNAVKKLRRIETTK